ncbi:hypothetical protein FGW37_19460 [Streptomyces rectiverticillatus]|uniref:ferritin-like domain-containing protein n=1 Tax=Streptomyces rectiverticillatus TaxID=173860 RepID=UPI0015C35578|nr:ferritin-like protein [Streptomyces rectiverticillatus]QLE73473.1 hypothetical protein FGW37_19460 [Streptomyces rectiverticillatus]
MNDGSELLKRLDQQLQVAQEDRNLDWIKESLQTAIEVELSTIPPYLCGLWSVKDDKSPVAQLILGIVNEEMLHAGLCCNMLTAIGGTPKIRMPAYPAHLPGHLGGSLEVYLGGLTPDYVQNVFMAIERPESPAERFEGAVTIGGFYSTLLAAFRRVRPPITGDHQLTAEHIGLTYTISEPRDIERAIRDIKEQGEGTGQSPDAVHTHHELGHYYRFGEIHHGKKLIRTWDGDWGYEGGPVPFPDASPMARVPMDGWAKATDPAKALLATFNQTYTDMLKLLEQAWGTGDQHKLGDAVGKMFALKDPAVQLMQLPLPAPATGNYGPDFRYLG